VADTNGVLTVDLGWFFAMIHPLEFLIVAAGLWYSSWNSSSWRFFFESRVLFPTSSDYRLSMALMGRVSLSLQTKRLIMPLVFPFFSDNGTEPIVDGKP
jgi:hypothetical protein